MANIDDWREDWPNTDFTRHSVPLAEIRSGGVPKDVIRSIDEPVFAPVAEVGYIPGREPVIGLIVNGDARAYPLRILTRHEIVNDVVGGLPVAVTYCPLCNAAIVFDRRLDGEAVEFGTTGNLRHSDLVMYDRRTESWWQQFTGEAIVGEMTGTQLDMIPARLESLAKFRERAPEGKVLVPRRPSAYGGNPYPNYDSDPWPFLYRGEIPDGVPPMLRVVAVDGEAWTLRLLRAKGRIVVGDLILSWTEGQASALDTRRISEGREVGNVVVQRVGVDGAQDIVYDLTFAFVFFAFEKDGVLYTRDGDVRWSD